MQKKQPVPEYYFAPGEWDRLGCGPLPDERNLELQRTEKNSAENKNGLDSSIDNRQYYYLVLDRVQGLF